MVVNSAQNIWLVKTRSGTQSLRVTCEDGSTKTLHSLYDPESEARSVVDAFEFNGNGILVVLGLGLGYHVAELARKFPDTDILVVESSHAICEFARNHGAALSNRIKIINGRPCPEVLREITDRQMKEGFVPVSVLALSSAVSAFPDYYRPILSSLQNVTALKLWERLRYLKFRKEQLNIVLIDTGYFLIREVDKALRSLDHNVHRVPVRTDRNGENVLSKLVEAILNFKPDILLTINHLGFDEDGILTSFFDSIEMPVASWYVDSPNLIVRAFDKNVSPCVSLFVWDKSYISDMKSMGFESVAHLPLGTDERLFKPLTARKHHKKLQKYHCDTGFVGNSMVEPVEEWMGKVSRSLHPLIEKIAERLAIAGSSCVSLQEELQDCDKRTIDMLTEKEKMNFEAAVLWKATLWYRRLCIRSLDTFDVTIHGDAGWQTLLDRRKFKLLPPLNYYRELPFFYNACKVNVNATSRQMNGTVNQRVFDVPACGAFLLTDMQQELHDFFEVGKEIVMYKHRDDIPEIVRFYLKFPEERKTIAAKGRARVLKEHTYRHRLERLIQAMKKKYK